MLQGDFQQSFPGGADILDGGLITAGTLGGTADETLGPKGYVFDAGKNDLGSTLSWPICW